MLALTLYLTILSGIYATIALIAYFVIPPVKEYVNATIDAIASKLQK